MNKNKKTNENPSQEQLNILLKNYQNSEFNKVEKLAKSIIKNFSNNQLSWKILGLVYWQKGRISDAIDATQNAVNLFPEDYESQNNLGNLFKSIGRLSEAEYCFKRAIKLKPNVPEIHYNLGNTLKELNRLYDAKENFIKALSIDSNFSEAYFQLGQTLIQLDRLFEAEKSLRQAILTKPNFYKAYFILGNILKKMDRLDEAAASYSRALILKQDYTEAYNNRGVVLTKLKKFNDSVEDFKMALTLRPNFAEAYNNLGFTLTELGRLNEAKDSCMKAISLKPDYIEAMHNLSIVESYMNNLKAEIILLEKLFRLDPDNYGLRAAVNLAICYFLGGDFSRSRETLLSVAKIHEMKSSNFKNEQTYRRYLLNILKFHEGKSFDLFDKEKSDIIFVIGESHSLIAHYLNIKSSTHMYFLKAKLIKGCMQWHLGNSKKNKYKSQFEDIFNSIPKSSEVLLTIGEIDCRLDSGIIKHCKKYPEKDIQLIISSTVANYIDYIHQNNLNYKHNIIIQGVPCPNINIKNVPKEEVKELIEVVKIFNTELKNKSNEQGFKFLDVYKLTNRGDGFSNSVWHIDDNHLNPKGFIKAWDSMIPIWQKQN